MIATMTEVIQVSLREVQVILRASARTSRMNWPGLVFFFGAASATGEDEPIATAVFAARFLIACGVEPGFLAMVASSNSSWWGRDIRAPFTDTYSGRSGG